MCAFIQNSPEFINNFSAVDDELLSSIRQVFEVTGMPISKLLI